MAAKIPLRYKVNGGIAGLTEFESGDYITGDWIDPAILEAINSKQTALGFTAENILHKGAANGYCPLNSSSLIDSQYLPSYVDDILEYANVSSFPATGETGKIYVDKSTQNGRQYRWTGSQYLAVTNGFIASTNDVPDSTDKRYVTDENLTLLANLATNINNYLTASSTSILTNKILSAYKEAIATPSISSGNLTLDCSSSNIFKVAHNSNISALNFINAPASGVSYTATLKLIQDPTGGRTFPTLPSNFHIIGVAIDLNTAANKINIIDFSTDDGGANWIVNWNKEV